MSLEVDACIERREQQLRRIRNEVKGLGFEPETVNLDFSFCVGAIRIAGFIYQDFGYLSLNRSHEKYVRPYVASMYEFSLLEGLAKLVHQMPDSLEKMVLEDCLK